MGEDSYSQEHVVLRIFAGLLLLIEISQGTNADDVEALLAFKQQLNRDALPHWTGNNPCNWAGIRCGGPFNNSVVKLALPSMNLTGTLDPMVGNLSSLRKLNLSDNSFSGPIPSELRNCRGLEYIDLSRNTFSGKFSALFELRNLTVLNLSHNNLSDIILPNVGILENLEVLNLSGNRNLYGEIPDEIGNCSSLQILDLAANRFSGAIPPSIFHLRRLRYLVLKKNMLNGTLDYMDSTSFGLKRLALHTNHLSGRLPRFIVNLTELQVLKLAGNLFTGSIPLSLSGLRNLEILDLSGNMLSGSIPTEIGQLSAMRELSLQLNALSGPIPRELFDCRNLTTLFLQSNQLISSIPREIGSLSLLRSLQLNDNNLTGSIPAELANCSRLVDIRLGTNYINGGLPAQLATLNNLTSLFVENNLLIGVISSQFSSMASLEYIVLSDNFLTGKIPDNFSSSCQLLNLELAGNQLTGHLPLSLGNLRRLQKVDVSRNQISGGLSGFAASNTAKDLSVIQLQCLILHDNLLSGNLEVNFSGMNSLLFVDLHGNELVGPVPPSLGDIFQVQYIDLSSNQFSGAIPSELGKCQYLTTLNLSFNRLENPIPGGIADSWKFNDVVVADFSNNHLSGKIPESLNLAHLGLNLSNNDLSGPIPGLLQHLGPNSFLRNPALCGPPLANECEELVAKKKKDEAVKFIVLGVALGCSTTVVFLLVVCFKGHRGVQIEGIGNSQSSVTSVAKWFGDTCSNEEANNKPPKLTPTLSDLSLATKGFSSDYIIGDGGFGKVYKGVLSDGTAVAIKKLTEDGYQGEREFDAELKTLGSVNHQNLVRLFGYCSNGIERLLVYEYMPNNSLDVWLYCRTEGMGSLPWGVRTVIAKDVARGLTFLHHFCIPKIVHRDLKVSNILLDANFHARLGDFGLARHLNTYESHINTAVAGSLGYIAPEYAQSWRVTTRGDVFSFGVVILELLSGKRPACGSYKPTHNGNLVSWVQYLFRTKQILDMFFDSSLDPVKGSALEKELMNLVYIALRCTQEDPSKRPVMLEVLRLLEVAQ